MPVARTEKDKRLKIILEFANELESKLQAASVSKESTALSHEVERQINAFPNTFHAHKDSRCDEIDSIGTTIWNHATRLRRETEGDKPESVPVTLLLARVFAFLLLDAAYQSGRSESSNVLRLMKTGTKAAKSCLQRNQQSLALKVLEKLGGYETWAKKPDNDSMQNDKEDWEGLIAEYYVLRTILAWRQDKLDVAEHMFRKTMSSKQYFDTRTAESLADALYEMGKELLNKQQYTMSVKWLERAYEVLNNQELEKLSMDGSELRISIIQMSVKALLALETIQTTAKAQDLIELLETEIGDKLVVLLLKLEVISSTTAETIDNNKAFDIIQRMIRSVPLNDNNFRLLMFHIRKLSERSHILSCKALEELLQLRLLNEEKEEWTEKVFITHLWIMVKQKDTTDGILTNAISSLVSTIIHPLRPPAAHAAHMLLWKKIESGYAQGQHDAAEKWCQLALHPAFGSSGDLNLARISRKMLLCALGKHDFAGAREIFNAMTETARDEPLSRFLMYKVAIRTNDIDLAAECLAKISATSSKDPTMIYACCLDAQQAGNKEQTLLVLQLVLESTSHKPCDTLHMPSLIRLTIGLMESLITEYSKYGDISKLEQTIDKLCATFEAASADLRRSRSHGKVNDMVWAIDELDWLSKNSYNIAIEHLSSWDPRQSVRILVCCIIFIDHYPSDIGEQAHEDLTLRKMFCEFSAATALVSLARSEDNNEIRLQDYLSLRKHVNSFDILLQEKLSKLDEMTEQDLCKKLSILAAFDFEAACQLKDWDSLHDVVIKADVCKSSQIYEVMADIILCSQAPTQVLVNTMKTIVNEVWSLESLDIDKLAKYTRCLFQAALSSNPEVAESLLKRIADGAEAASETPNPYPTPELEYVSTKAFNHAVDLYCINEDEACKRWFELALRVVRFVEDGGVLRRLLEGNLARLRLDTS